MSKFKECPYCGEEILAKALKCKHCHSMLEEVKQASAAPVEEMPSPAVAPPPPPRAEKPMAPPPPPGAEKPMAPPPPPRAEKPMAPPPPPGAEKPMAPPPPPGAEKPMAPPPPPGAEKPMAPLPPPVNTRQSSSPPPPPVSTRQSSSPPPPPVSTRQSSSPPPPPVNTRQSSSPPPPPVSTRQSSSPPPPPVNTHQSSSPSVGSVYQQSPGVPLQNLGAGAPGAVYNYEKAGIGKRVLAYFIDMILACIGLFVTAPIAFIPMYRFIISDGWITPSGFQWVLIVLGLIIGFGWALFYSLLRDGFGQGQSIGKKATGLMVVRLTDNLPCTKKDSLVRNVVAVGLGIILGWIPVINFFAGFAEPIIAIIHQKGMRLGDIVAKTQVIVKGEYRR